MKNTGSQYILFPIISFSVNMMFLFVAEVLFFGGKSHCSS